MNPLLNTPLSTFNLERTLKGSKTSLTRPLAQLKLNFPQIEKFSLSPQKQYSILWGDLLNGVFPLKKCPLSMEWMKGCTEANWQALFSNVQDLVDPLSNQIKIPSNLSGILDVLYTLFIGTVYITAHRPDPSSRVTPWVDGLITGKSLKLTSFDKTSQLILSSHFFIINSKKYGKYLATYDYYSAFVDFALQRTNVIIASSVTGGVFSSDLDLPTVGCLFKIWNWGDQILVRLGNNGYKILKSWESLLVSISIKFSEDNLVKNTQLLYEKVVEGILVELYECSELVSQFKEILKFLITLWKRHPQVYFQLHGLYRTWSHPSIDIVQGLDYLKTTGTRFRSVNVSEQLKLTAYFKRTLCRNYISKHGRWPNLDISKLTSWSYLRKCYCNREPFSIYHPAYEEYEWLDVHGEQTFELPEVYDFAEFLSDKSTSHGRKELIDCIRANGNIGISTDRSVLMKWINNNFENPADFLRNVDNVGFDPDENVIGIKEKEREMKLKGRFYALLPIGKRMYIVLTESMIARDILPLFPEVTTGKSMLEMQHEYYKATSKMGTSKQVIWSADYESWGPNQRGNETYPIFEFIDELYGLKKCISRTHEMFSESTIYYSGLMNPKELLNDQQNDLLRDTEYSWSNHLGGLEGLRQKGWTLVSLIQNQYVAEQMSISCKMMVQGDNQVGILTFPSSYPDTTIQDQTYEFMKALMASSTLFGPPFKCEETWASSVLFTFSKNPIFQGAPLSTSLKKVARLAPFSNTPTGAIDETLSSISANCAAASSCSSFKPVSIFYCMGLFYSIMALHLRFDLNIFGDYDPSVSNSFRVPVENQSYVVPDRLIVKKWKKGKNWIGLWKLVCLFPKGLGGFPIIRLQSLLYQGFPDHVTSDLFLLKALITLQHPIIRPLLSSLIGLLSPSFKPGIPQLRLLLENPSSINWLSPSSPSEKIRDVVIRGLKKMPIINRSVQALLQLHEAEDSELITNLLSLRPFSPRVLNMIYKATLESQIKKEISRLSKSSTLISLFRPVSDEKEIDEFLSPEDVVVRPVSHTVFIYEVNYLNSLVHRLTNPPYQVTGCVSHLAQRLREISWGLPLLGVTVVDPFEFLSCHRVDQNQICQFQEEGHVLGLLYPFTSLIKLGPCYPYLGSATEDKIATQKQQYLSKNVKGLDQALKNVSLINWITEPNSNLSKLILSMVRVYTNQDVSWLIPSEEDLSGVNAHRLQDESTSHYGHLGISYLEASFISTSTTELVKYSKGGTNFNLHFQAIKLVSSLMILATRTCAFTSTWYHFHQNCDCPVAVTNETHEIEKLIVPNTEGMSILFPHLGEYEIRKRRSPPNLIYQITSCQNIPKWLVYIAASWKLAADLWRRSSRAVLVEPGNIMSTPVSKIPVVWAFRIDPHELLSCMLIGAVLRAISLVSREHCEDQSSLLSFIFKAVENASITWWSLLAPLLHNPSALLQLSSSLPTSSLTGSYPIKETQITFLIREWGLSMLTPKYVLDILREWTQLTIVPVCAEELFHPAVVRSSYFLLLDPLKQYDNHQRVKDMVRQISLGDQIPLAEDTGLIEGSNIRYISMYPGENLKPNTDRISESLNNHSAIDLITLKSHLSYTMPSVKVSLSHPVNNPQVFSLDVLQRSIPYIEQDLYPYYFDMYRSYPLPSASVYKYLYIFVEYYDKVPKNGNVFCLADGTGGCTSLLHRLFPGLTCYHNSTPLSIDLYEGELLAPFHLIPPCCSNHFNYMPWTREYDPNILSESFLALLSNQFSEADILTCDAEVDLDSSVTSYIKLAERFSTIYHSFGASFGVFKTYQASEDQTWILASILKGVCKTLEIIRSPFSRPIQTEIFIILMGKVNITKRPLIQITNTSISISKFSVGNKQMDAIRKLTALKMIPSDLLDLSLSLTNILHCLYNISQSHLTYSIIQLLQTGNANKWIQLKNYIMSTNRLIKFHKINTRSSLIRNLITHDELSKWILMAGAVFVFERRNQFQHVIPQSINHFLKWYFVIKQETKKTSSSARRGLSFLIEQEKPQSVCLYWKIGDVMNHHERKVFFRFIGTVVWLMSSGRL